jgi:hypothetical protein
MFGGTKNAFPGGGGGGGKNTPLPPHTHHVREDMKKWTCLSGLFDRTVSPTFPTLARR